MLASSAPAESETMLDVASASRPDPETCVAHTHTVVAATNWSTATKLVARCTAPNCVRSPNLRIIAMRLTNTARKSS